MSSQGQTRQGKEGVKVTLMADWKVDEYFGKRVRFEDPTKYLRSRSFHNKLPVDVGRVQTHSVLAGLRKKKQSILLASFLLVMPGATSYY